MRAALQREDCGMLVHRPGWLVGHHNSGVLGRQCLQILNCEATPLGRHRGVEVELEGFFGGRVGEARAAAGATAGTRGVERPTRGGLLVAGRGRVSRDQAASLSESRRSGGGDGGLRALVSCGAALAAWRRQQEHQQDQDQRQCGVGGRHGKWGE